MAQIHKNLTDEQVKSVLMRYLNKEIKSLHACEMLGIKRRRFFILLQKYQSDPEKFSIQYARKIKTNMINPDIERNILSELKTEKQLIENKDIPIRFYNYSFIKQQLEEKHKQSVSLPTIINKAKQHGFYIQRLKQKTHTREVITDNAGELVQHDSSFHKWSPYAKEKWCLITSIDDYSRYMLYAALLPKESSIAHIKAMEYTFLRYGLPLSFYVDSHSIFRFVRGRDELWYKHHLQTDEAVPQWKQVLLECNVKPIYALSPQAKGKVERPYGWLQDHIVRLCYRDGVKDIRCARAILNREVYQYNYRRIHSTTLEIPHTRFQRALQEKQSLFRPFTIKPPYQSTKDIFALRFDRTVDSYRKISISNLQFTVNAPVGATLNLRIYPSESSGLTEVRCWHKNQITDIHRVKNNLINIVHF